MRVGYLSKAFRSRRWRVRFWEERGSLLAGDEGVQFIGAKGRFVLRNVRKVEPMGFPSLLGLHVAIAGACLGLAILFILVFSFVPGVSLLEGGVLVLLTGVLGLAAGLAVGPVLALTVLSLWMQAIEVHGEDEAGQDMVVWFVTTPGAAVQAGTLLGRRMGA